MITQTPSTVVTVRAGEASFFLKDGSTLVPRAAIEIANNCPSDIIKAITIGFERGWLKAVAYVPETDPTLLWDILKS